MGRLIEDRDYDLCFNISPFVLDTELGAPNRPVLSFVNHSPTLIRNEQAHVEINHYTYQVHQFIREWFSRAAKPVRNERMLGVGTYYSDATLDRVSSIAKEFRLYTDRPVIMLNPDTASPYTLLPFDNQARLLNLLVQGDAQIILGEGHAAAGIGYRLLETVPTSLRSKIRILPKDFPLPVYSALIDFADVFITGDTGPMHIAASRKHSSSRAVQFRNSTAVYSIFGATIPRLSAYDSSQSGYLPAYQNAPSWCYAPDSPCRNISCLNKMFKTCKTVRCFEGFSPHVVADQIHSYVSALEKRAPFMRGSASGVSSSVVHAFEPQICI